MAGGKLSARQKMINLMYLVFIAMLALNMSKEVLSAFGLMNAKLTEANTATTARNNAFMESLATKAADEPEQYASVKADADKVTAFSQELDSYIQELKTGMVAEFEDPTDYEVMDKADYLDQKWFTGGDVSEDGLAFVSKLGAFRDGMMNILPEDKFPEIRKSIDNNFATNPKDVDGVEKTWLSYNYEGFPAVASLTKLTQLQADIKTTRNEVLQKMLAGKQADALSFKNYNTFLDVPKSAYYPGEKFEGAILLGRTDNSTQPKRVELTLDGKKLNESQYKVEGGRVVLNIGAGGAGDHKIGGFLYYGEEGEEVEVPVEAGFATITKPNSAVIAADKMNVVYRGVTNPMTVSIPGIPDNKVTASGTGLSSAGGSKYNMNPGTGREVTITASGTLPDGQRISTPATFRIKDIPRPTGTIRGEDGDGGCVKMQRQGLEISSIGAALLDFDFDLKLNVSSFSFKVSGQPTVRVNGTKLNSQAKGSLKRAKRGETVQIFDIQAKISGNSGYRLRKISPICIELTN